MLQPNSLKTLSHHCHLSGKVEFENVVRFNPHAAPVVKSVSFSIDSSKFIGVVGQSGSGKYNHEIIPRCIILKKE